MRSGSVREASEPDFLADPSGGSIMAEKRKFIDCREMPSESGCSLKISGTEVEVLKAAREHAVSSHGHADSVELVAMIRAGLKDEAA
jgi:hypothetical protein